MLFRSGQAANLYQFWDTRIAEYLNQQLQGQKTPVVVNLASQEYFKSVDRKALQARVIECVFEDWKGGKYKIISFFAKRARGMMARYAIDNAITDPDRLKGFDRDGYAFDADASGAQTWVFRRRSDAA